MTNTTPAVDDLPIMKGSNYAFWEWYCHVAHTLYFGSVVGTIPRVSQWNRVPLPSGDVENAQPGSIEAMYNCNYLPEVAAAEIVKRRMVPRKPLSLTDAAMLTYRLNGNMGSDLFSKGGDAPARRALAEALGIKED